MKKVITISREFGSGGHDIGMEVAKRLNIPFYDQEIVDKAVAESGFTKEFIEEHGEYSTLSSVLLGTSAPFDSYYYAEDPQDKIFKIQRRIIKKFAQEGPCVIVGRCSNYILEQADIDSFDVFIKADIEKSFLICIVKFFNKVFFVFGINHCQIYRKQRNTSRLIMYRQNLISRFILSQ